MKKNILLMLVVALMLSVTGLEAKQKLSSVGTRGLRDAKMKLQQKNFDKALEFYLKVLESDPNSIEALAKVGQINYSYGSDRSKGKLSYFETAYGYYKQSIEAYDKLLADGFPQKKLKAEKKLIEAVNKEIGYPIVKLQIEGTDAFNDGAYEEALEYFQKAYELNPDSLKSLVGMGPTYMKLEKTAEAIETYELLMTAEPANIQTLQTLAGIYYNNDQIEKAAEMYQAILVITPNDVSIMFNVSVAYINLKKYEEALAMNEAILALEPENVDALNNASQLINSLKFNYNKEEGKEEAIKALDEKAIVINTKLVDLDPSADTVSTFCYALSQAKRWELLLVYSQRWHELDATSKPAIQMVMLAGTKTGEKAIVSEYSKKLNTLDKK